MPMRFPVRRSANWTRVLPLLLAWPVFAQYVITTVGGGGVPNDVPGVSASLNPQAVAADSAGNLYIGAPYIVYRLSSAGRLTVFAGKGVLSSLGDGGPASSGGVNLPSSLAVDSSGNVYIADSQDQRVRKVETGTRTIRTVAGTGTAGDSGDGGPASHAQLHGPMGIAVDSVGNVYIADTANNRICEVDAHTGAIATVAGTGTAGSSGDGGPAREAQLNSPRGVAVDGAGNVYIADYGNSSIRVVAADTGIISTLSGAEWGSPAGIAVDAAGNLYMTEPDNHRIRKAAADTRAVTTIAGTGAPGYSGDNGPAIGAQVNLVLSVALDGSGNLYLADSYNNRIRKVTAAGMITTVAGGGPAGDGGSATSAQLSAPNGIAVDRSGNVYVADTGNHRIRRVAADTGIVTTVAGTGTAGYSGDGRSAMGAQLNTPHGVAMDGNGNLYIADTANYRIRKVAADTGIITTVAGTGTAGYSGDGGAATSAQLNYSTGVFVDNDGNIYIAGAANNRIRKVAADTGIITTVAGTGEAGYSGDGGAATDAQLNYPAGVFVDNNGNIYIAGAGSNRIRKVAADTAVISTVAGSGNPEFGGDGEPATSAGLYQPRSVAIDGSGNVYIADYGNHSVRQVAADTGIITTVAGTGEAGYSGDGGPAASARLMLPTGLAVDSTGNIYFADQGSGHIRKLYAPTAAASGPAITTDSSLVTGVAGAMYAQVLEATGGVTPYKKWSVTGGSLPAGLALNVSDGNSTAWLRGILAVAGDFSFTLQLTDGANVAVSKSFSLTITATAIEATLNSVVNAASFLPGRVAPGEMVTLFGAGIGPAAPARLKLSLTGRIDNVLGGARVLFDGIAAPLVYAQSSQLSALVPYEVAGKVSTQVQVEYRGQRSNPIRLAVAAAAPGIFTVGSSGSGAGAIVNENGSTNSSVNPAARGSAVTVYATGEGQTDPPGVDGKPAEAPFPRPRLPVSAKIGGVNAEVLYAGAAPGLVAGILQINLRVPGNVPAGGALPIVIQIGNQRSQPGAMIAVR